MIKVLLFDFSRVILFPKDKNYTGKLNDLYRQLLKKSNYHFFDYFEINKELLSLLDKLRNRVDLCIFTSEIIQEAPELQSYLLPLFKKVYSALEIGVDKKDPKAYSYIVHDLGLKPEDIVFIDDSLENLSAAKSAGLSTLWYQSNDRLFQEINALAL